MDFSFSQNSNLNSIFNHYSFLAILHFFYRYQRQLSSITDY